MYNKKDIMKKAWDIRKTANVSMSVALKSAWATAKAIIKAEKVASDIDWNTRIKINNWVKGNHNRTYIEVAIYTNAWNRKGVREIGYINNLTGEFVAA